MAPKARSRAAGDKHALVVAALQEHFTTPRRAPNYGPKLQKKVLAQQASLLVRLERVQTNLSFTPMMMQKALQEVAESKMETWRFSKQDCEQFACDVGPRLRLMCRHFAQAMDKKAPPKWVSAIQASASQTQIRSYKDTKSAPGDEHDDPCQEDEEEEEEEQEDTDDNDMDNEDDNPEDDDELPLAPLAAPPVSATVVLKKPAAATAAGVAAAQAATAAAASATWTTSTSSSAGWCSSSPP